MKYLIDSDTSWLTVGANHVSVSLLQRTQIADKDAVIKIYKPDLCFKHRTCLHILPW